MLNPNISTAELIKKRLTEALHPVTIDLEDNSTEHAGHPGAQKGGGHYSLLIVSDAFINKSPVARHQMIYKALDGLIGGAIHALSINAKTSAEHQ